MIVEEHNLSSRKAATMYKYAIEIFYSDEDGRYTAMVPELPGCSAFGKTEEVALELWIETAKKEGRKLPLPKGKELLKKDQGIISPITKGRPDN
jgi:predicted RNase H-like HicB family nuclease